MIPGILMYAISTACTNILQKTRCSKLPGNANRPPIGCVDCKKLLAQNINNALKDFRQRRIELAKDPEHIYCIIDDGARRAEAIARITFDEVKHKMGLLRNA